MIQITCTCSTTYLACRPGGPLVAPTAHHLSAAPSAEMVPVAILFLDSAGLHPNKLFHVCACALLVLLRGHVAAGGACVDGDGPPAHACQDANKHRVAGHEAARITGCVTSCRGSMNDMHRLQPAPATAHLHPPACNRHHTTPDAGGVYAHSAMVTSYPYCHHLPPLTSQGHGGHWHPSPGM